MFYTCPKGTANAEQKGLVRFLIMEKAELSLLLDYYGAFLTERQRDIARMSADEDMSLAEIAEVVGVSRQGVRDSIVKAALKLAEFEEKLGLAERDRRLRSLLKELTEAAEASDTEGVMRSAEALKAVLR